MTTIRSPARMTSSPPGRSIWSPRMTAATFESRGNLRVAERHAENVLRRALLDVELDDLDLALGEDVGLTGGGDADDPADGVCGLELGADDEVDVELTDAPQLHVLDVGRADHRRRASASRRANMPATRLTSSREVQAMTRSAFCTPAAARIAPARPVAFDGHHVVALGEPRRDATARCRAP